MSERIVGFKVGSVNGKRIVYITAWCHKSVDHGKPCYVITPQDDPFSAEKVSGATFTHLHEVIAYFVANGWNPYVIKDVE